LSSQPQVRLTWLGALQNAFERLRLPYEDFQVSVEQTVNKPYLCIQHIHQVMEEKKKKKKKIKKN
jgi:hypothetical protein